jgi:quinol monooxygenase YgiN
MFIAIAIHHHAPEHAEEFVDFMHRVVAATAGARGLIDFRPFRARGRRRSRRW